MEEGPQGLGQTATLMAEGERGRVTLPETFSFGPTFKNPIGLKYRGRI